MSLAYKYLKLFDKSNIKASGKLPLSALSKERLPNYGE